MSRNHKFIRLCCLRKLIVYLFLILYCFSDTVFSLLLMKVSEKISFIQPTQWVRTQLHDPLFMYEFKGKNKNK